MEFPPPSQKQARILWLSVTSLSIGVLLGLLGLLAFGVGWLVNRLAPILWPLAIAGILAYLLEPLVDFFERHRIPRPRAILLVFIICLGGVLAFLGQILPRLVFETKRLIEEVPNYTKQVQQNVSDWVSRRPILVDWKDRIFREGTGTNPPPTIATPTPVPPPSTAPSPEVASPPAAQSTERAFASRLVEAALQWVAQVAPKVGQWLVNRVTQVASWAGMIIGLALIPVFAFYLLLQKDAIQRTWMHYLPIQESRFKEEVVFVLTAINNYLIAFFRGQVVVAMCIGGLLTVGFLCLGLNYAVLLGALAGLLSIVPYLGAIMTIIPSILLAAVQFKDWLHPFLVLAVFAAVQTLEGMVISPKIMGDRVGLHPMTIIVAVLVGTNLMGGILGGILAIPLTAALRVIMFRYVWKQPRNLARAAA